MTKTVEVLVKKISHGVLEPFEKKRTNIYGQTKFIEQADAKSN